MSMNSSDETNGGAACPSDNGNTPEQDEQLRNELAKLEYEIQTLRSVLAVKMREAAELKRRLGISQISELKDDFRHGLQTVKESGMYQKTNAALRSFGGFASRKFGDLRNSTMFRSVEDKVGGAYSSIKGRMQASRSENNFDDAVRENEMSAANAGYARGSLPEDKVPL